MAKLKKHDMQLLAQLKQGDTFDKIFAWYVFGESKVPLTDKESEVQQRWEAAFSLLCNYHSIENAVPLLMKQFDVSRATAYTDLRQALRLFGDVNKSSKEGQRYVLSEYSMRIFQLAATQKPPDLDNMNKAVANIIKLRNLDKEDGGQIPWEKLIPPSFEPTDDITTIEGMQPLTNLEEITRRLKHDLNITDVDYEDVSNE